MDTEEVFACSLQESYYEISGKSFVKPPLLSHTPDYDHYDSNVSQYEDDTIGTPLLYAIEPLSNVEDDVFALDQDFPKEALITPDYYKTKTIEDPILISELHDYADAPVYSVPQENYRLWLEKF